MTPWLKTRSARSARNARNARSARSARSAFSAFGAFGAPGTRIDRSVSRCCLLWTLTSTTLTFAGLVGVAHGDSRDSSYCPPGMSMRSDRVQPGSGSGSGTGSGLAGSGSDVCEYDEQTTLAARSAEPVRESVTAREELLGKVEAIDSMRVVMHAREPSDRLAIQLESLLTALGVPSVERRIVDQVPESNQIRYYHESDREAGAVMGEALSLVFDEVAVRDFVDYVPSPSRGLIEIWLR